MDDFNYTNYCQKCIDDHEVRIREIEKNNKEQVKLYVEREKLDIRINVLDDKCEFKFASLEKLMETKIAEVKREHNTERKEGRSDIYAIIGMIISIGTFIILVWKLT